MSLIQKAIEAARNPNAMDVEDVEYDAENDTYYYPEGARQNVPMPSTKPTLEQQALQIVADEKQRVIDQQNNRSGKSSRPLDNRVTEPPKKYQRKNDGSALETMSWFSYWFGTKSKTHSYFDKE